MYLPLRYASIAAIYAVDMYIGSDDERDDDVRDDDVMMMM